ncbi:hypothetical protein QJS04_geneDACA010868 [Acorus gramineus]|uniref:Uncharacterized protein n=1 Tax=Acorus gramineus TaxID=55184 RepID=A0AAV9B9H8_ACOGR|nr:hypothetical protein QJS04_geneDACA010868 [Acorus gramineus]
MTHMVADTKIQSCGSGIQRRMLGKGEETCVSSNNDPSNADSQRVPFGTQYKSFPLQGK